MAERPAVFTVSPWGYRLLSPVLARSLSGRNVVRGFRHLTVLALAGAGAALYSFLRRRGHTPWAAFVGVAAFGLAPPVARVAELPFFVDPAGVLLLILFLLAVEARAGRAVLALLGTLLAYAKDPTVVLVLAPAVFVARWTEGGTGRGREAVLDTLAAVVPAALTEPLLRAWWTPGVPSVVAPLGRRTIEVALGTLLETWKPTAGSLLVGGLMPLALVGALRREARPTVVRYGLTLLGLVCMAMLAWVRVPSPVPVPLFGENVGRVLIYALPVLVTFGLIAVDRVFPNLGPPLPAAVFPGWLRLAASVAAAGLLFVPFVALDRYRRIDLQRSRDGPLVLAFCRETWRTAVRLRDGEAVTFTPESHRFHWGETDVGRQGRLRWFLRDGWGTLAHYGAGPITMQAAQADLVLPLLTPHDVEVTLGVSAPGTRLALFANGRPVAEWVADAPATRRVSRIPAPVLFRGDNVLTLTATDGGSGARLLELTYRRSGR
jgi:hypothetical protein